MCLGYHVYLGQDVVNIRYGGVLEMKGFERDRERVSRERERERCR